MIKTTRRNAREALHFVQFGFAAALLCGCAAGPAITPRGGALTPPEVAAAPLPQTLPKVALRQFEAADGLDSTLMCRASGALDVAPGRTPVEAMREAFAAEFARLGALGEADATPVDIVVRRLSVSSFGAGTWRAAVHVRSPAAPQGFVSDIEFLFPAGLAAGRACQAAADAFHPAMAALARRVLVHPQFARLGATLDPN